MTATAVMERGFEVSDVSGQKIVEVSNVPSDATVSELIQGLLARLRLPANDSSGRPVSYRARSDREARHLRGDERVSDAVHEGDRLVLQPNIDAGAGGIRRG